MGSAASNSAIGTLVERSTRFTILLHLPGDHTADTVAAAMIEAMSELPDHLRRSITWDRGSEMANWEHIKLQLNSPVFFESPWFRWRLGLLDFDQGLVGPVRSVEDGFELCGR